MLDLHILAVGHDGTVLVAVGAVQAVGQVTGGVVVVDKVEEGGVVGAVHIGAALFDDRLQVVRGGVQGMLVGKTVAAGAACPVYTTVVAVAPVAGIADVEVLILVVALVLVHNDGLTLVDVQTVEGQQQLEELVTTGADGTELADILVVHEHRHKAGDAALDLDLDQNIRLGQTALGACIHDVVDHDAGDALPLGVVGILFLAGQDVGLIRFGGGFGGRLGGGLRGGGSGRCGRIHGRAAAAGCQRQAQRKHSRCKSDQTFHNSFPLSCGGMPQNHLVILYPLFRVL